MEHRADDRYLAYRKKIIFSDYSSKDQFEQACKDIAHSFEKLVQQDGAIAYQVSEWALNIAIDLRSYLPRWKLLCGENATIITPKLLEKQSDAFLQLGERIGGKKRATLARAEIERINQSQIKAMSEARDDGKLNNYWGHDFAYGLTDALRRGAAWVTSNPCKITLFRKAFPSVYDSIVAEIKSVHSTLSLDDHVSLLFTRICAYSAEELYPIFEATDGQFGYVFMQVNPFNNFDANKMVEQVHFFHNAMSEELNGRKPNVCYKLPAYGAGNEAAKQLIAEGYQVNLTLNFSVMQHEYFASLISEEKQHGFVVFMAGYLDDAVARDLIRTGIPREQATKISRFASQAVMRRSYKNLAEKKLDRNAHIMTAAVRGPWTIENALVPADGSYEMITTTKEMIEKFDENSRDLISTINESVPSDIIEILSRSHVFRKAYSYLGDNELQYDDLDSYEPLMNVLDTFLDAYSEVEESIRSF